MIKSPSNFLFQLPLPTTSPLPYSRYSCLPLQPPPLATVLLYSAPSMKYKWPSPFLPPSSWRPQLPRSSLSAQGKLWANFRVTSQWGWQCVKFWRECRRITGRWGWREEATRNNDDTKISHLNIEDEPNIKTIHISFLPHYVCVSFHFHM